MDAQATAKEVIPAVLDSMRESSEPLLHGVLVPSYYDVCLHHEDYHRLSTVLPGIREESILVLAPGACPQYLCPRPRILVGAAIELGLIRREYAHGNFGKADESGAKDTQALRKRLWN
jgi:hypothetical protein